MPASKVQISPIQTALLFFVSIAGTQILLLPNQLSIIAKQDSWIGSILGVCLGIGITFLYIAFMRQFPNKTLAEINELILGKVVGKVLSFVYYFYFFIVIILMIRFFNEFATISYFIRTPIITFHIMLTIIVLYGAWLGLETITRALEVVFPFIFLLLFVLIIFSTPNIETSNFLPMLENGIKPIVQNAVQYQFFTTLQFAFILILSPSFPKKNAIQSILIGTIICGVVLVFITFLAIGVLGADVVNLTNYATYSLAKDVYIGDFITRIEVFIVWLWFLTIYFKVVVLFYATSVGISQSLNVSDYRILLIPLGIIVVTLANSIYPNVGALEKLLPYWNSFVVTIGFIIPLFMLLLAKIRKLK